MMSKVCTICHSSDNIKLHQSHSFFPSLPVYYCQRCKYYFNCGNGSDIIDRCKKYYRDEYWFKFQNQRSRSLRKKIRRYWLKFLFLINSGPLNSIAYYKLLKQLIFISKKTQFFDIGCGDGSNLEYWNKKTNISALEPDDKNVQMINKKFNKIVCHQGFIEESDICGTFDIIYMSHVFEHLYYPDVFLENIKKKFNPGGVLFISVPNCDNAKILKLSINNQPHLFHFTKTGLEILFKEHGFQILLLETFKERVKVSKVDKIGKQLINILLNIIFSIFKINNLKKAPMQEATKIIAIIKSAN